MLWVKTKVRCVAVKNKVFNRADAHEGEKFMFLPDDKKLSHQQVCGIHFPAAAPESTRTLIMKLRVICKEELILRKQKL